MIEQEDKKIKENKAPVQPKQEEATLDLQGLFSLFEELQPTLALKEESDKSFVALEEIATRFIIPQVVFRENDVPVGQDLIKDFMRENAYGEQSLSKKMQALNIIATTTSAGKVFKRGNAFENLVNRIALTEAIMSTFSGFAPTTAGNVNERIISLFYEGAKLLPTLEANKNKDVTDFFVGDISYTLKTTKKETIRSSSALNFANTLSNYSKIVSLDCEKIFDGERVVGFSVSEEEITKENAFEKVFLRSKSENPSHYIAVQTGEGTDQIESLSQYLQAFEEKEDPNTRFKFVIVGENNEVAVAQTPDQIKKCFQAYDVTYRHGRGEAAEVRFNTDQMKQQLQTLIKDVARNIITLKTSLEFLGSSISKYFVSTADNKKELRQQMLDAAQKTIPKETEEIVAEPKK